MNPFETIQADPHVNALLDNANYNLNEVLNFINKTTGINYFRADHGRYHATYASNMTARVLQALSCDAHTIMLGKIAGLLHDIGVNYGKKGHAELSGNMSIEILAKTSLSLEDRHIIHQAIQDHSNGENIKSAVGAALLIADKTDVSKARAGTLKKDLHALSPAELNKWDDFFVVEEVEIRVATGSIAVNFKASEAPAVIKEHLLGWTNKANPIIEKACAFLNCTCRFEINGTPYEGE